jgi:hypothetical protein
MIINDLDGYYIVFDTKNWNTELDTLATKAKLTAHTSLRFKFTHVYIHVLSNSNSKPLPSYNRLNQEVYKFKKTIYVYMPK